MKSKSTFWTYLVVACGAAGLVSGLFVLRLVTSAPPKDPLTLETQALTSCIKDTVDFMKPEKVDFEFYENVWRLCGNQSYNNLVFVDFAIRREKFVQQEFDERVNLWMVVAITISGVVLAGVQLFMSYKLASAGRGDLAKDSLLVAEQGKISLQSSVTGVVILVLSLVFFIVYVKWIYSVEEFKLERPNSLEQAPVAPQRLPGRRLLDGGIGSPSVSLPESPLTPAAPGNAQ
jgi:hypothetical protein